MTIVPRQLVVIGLNGIDIIVVIVFINVIGNRGDRYYIDHWRGCKDHGLEDIIKRSLRLRGY